MAANGSERRGELYMYVFSNPTGARVHVGRRPSGCHPLISRDPLHAALHDPLDDLETHVAPPAHGGTFVVAHAHVRAPAKVATIALHAAWDAGCRFDSQRNTLFGICPSTGKTPDDPGVSGARSDRRQSLRPLPDYWRVIEVIVPSMPTAVTPNETLSPALIEPRSMSGAW